MEPNPLTRLADLNIDMKQIDTELEVEGIEKFVKPYESLLETLGQLQQNA